MDLRIPVGELELGMFVVELDRPWLGTPFLLQGFLIQDQNELQELRAHCLSVIISQDRSVGLARKHLSRFVPISTELPEPISTSMKTAPPRLRPPPGPLVAIPVAASGSFINNIRAILGETLKPAPAAGRPRIVSMEGGQSARDQSHFVKSRKASKEESETQRIQRVQQDAESSRRSAVDAPRARILSKDYRLMSSSGSGSKIDRDSRVYGDLEFIDYEDSATLDEELPRARISHNAGADTIEQLIHDMRKDFVFKLERVNEVVDNIVDSMLRNPEAMFWLTRLKGRSETQYHHGLDASVYMIAFGRHLGFPRSQLDNFGVCGLLLDIGKTKISDEVIGKKGPLSEEEFQMVKSHVQLSLDIVSDADRAPLEVLDAIATHHERMDGSGYPAAMNGDSIGMIGSIAGIVDTFAAMTRDRPYAAAHSAQQVLQAMYSWRDIVFPAALIDQFIQCIGLYPPGSLVELNTGEVAVVVSQNRLRRLKPKVLIILDPLKKPYKSLRTVDLFVQPSAPDGSAYQILRPVIPATYGIDAHQYYLLDSP